MGKMKAFLLAAALAFSLSACGGAGNAETDAGTQASDTGNLTEDVGEDTQSDPELEEAGEDAQPDPELEEAGEDAQPDPESKETGSQDGASGENKVLVVYFSAGNRTDQDAVSQATPMAGGQAATELLAGYIHNAVGGDIAKIMPTEDYPVGYDETADQAKGEQDNGERPEFTLDVDPEEYDLIFVGYPVWWYRIPMIMDTFFETYDFSGKTIVPFNTHAGSGDGGTYQIIEDYEPDATVLEGLAVSGNKSGDSEALVKEWLTGLGFTE